MLTHPDSRVAQAIAYFETLTPASLAHLGQVYAQDAHFADPFNEVQGLDAIQQVFVHMFAQLDAPRFEVLQAIAEGEQCFLLWNFHFSRKGRPQALRIHGGSHLRFAPDGRIAWHRDHWDPAREIYETLPVLGWVLRWLRGQLSAH